MTLTFFPSIRITSNLAAAPSKCTPGEHSDIVATDSKFTDADGTYNTSFR
jgi:hypothetical protein